MPVQVWKAAIVFTSPDLEDIEMLALETKLDPEYLEGVGFFTVETSGRRRPGMSPWRFRIDGIAEVRLTRVPIEGERLEPHRSAAW